LFPLAFPGGIVIIAIVLVVFVGFAITSNQQRRPRRVRRGIGAGACLEKPEEVRTLFLC
jgi:hypothetical protein